VAARTVFERAGSIEVAPRGDPGVGGCWVEKEASPPFAGSGRARVLPAPAAGGKDDKARATAASMAVHRVRVVLF
jgi:hypothetical protein